MVFDLKTIQKSHLVAFFVIGIFGVALLSLAGNEEDKTKTIRSVEIGVATVGPAGSTGGFAIPASCPSYEHEAGECNPDLTADIPADLGSVALGSVVSFSAIIRNVGGSDTSATFNNRFEIDLDSNGTWGDVVLNGSINNGIKVGKKKTANSDTWLANTLGNHLVRVNTADSGNVVVEKDETNNISEVRPFTVVELPPTVTISNTPFFTEQGQDFTITWVTNSIFNDCSVDRKPPGGSFAPWASSIGSGSKTTNETNPDGVYDFRVSCINGLGTSPVDTTSIEVKAKTPYLSITRPDLTPFTTINEGDPIRIRWTCYYSTSALGSGFGFNTMGVDFGNILVDPGPGTSDNLKYQISCNNGGDAFRTVVVRTPTLGIAAVPTIVQPDGNSTVTWTAFGVNSCTVTGTDGFFDSVPPTPPDLAAGDTWFDTITTGDLTEQTIYTLTCQTSLQTLEESVTININPIFEEF